MLLLRTTSQIPVALPATRQPAPLERGETTSAIDPSSVIVSQAHISVYHPPSQLLPDRFKCN